MTRRFIMTITGPSCAGKTTLLNQLVTEYPDRFVRLVSDVTRPPRPGEKRGEEYDFVSMELFEAREAVGEYAQIVQFRGICYGTRHEVIEKAFESGRVPVRIVEPSGVSQFQKICELVNATLFTIFVKEEPEELLERWLRRVHAEPNPDFEYLGERVWKTLKEEIGWIKLHRYDFFYDPWKRDPAEMRHALSRIATGSIAIGTARSIAPLIEEIS